MTNLKQTDRTTVDNELVSRYSQAGFLTITVVNPLSFYVLNMAYSQSGQRIEEDFVMSKNMLNTSSIYSSKPAKKGEDIMNTISRSFTGASNAIGNRPSQEELEDMKKVKAAKERNDEIAREKAANDAKIEREKREKEKKERQNPAYAALLGHIPTNDFVFCNSPEKLEYIFNSSNGYGFFGRMNNMGAAFIPVGGREINKNNFLRSVKVIFEETLTESIITVKRTEKDSKFTYKLVGEAQDQNDREVLIQSHMGKGKLGLNYDEDKKKAVKAYNDALDKVIKFVENYSTVEFKEKNFKKVRCNKKEIETLFDLIHKERNK